MSQPVGSNWFCAHCCRFLLASQFLNMQLCPGDALQNELDSEEGVDNDRAEEVLDGQKDMIQEILMDNRNGIMAVKRSSNNGHRGAARAAFDRKFPNAREAAQTDKAQLIEDMLSKTKWLLRSPLYTTKPMGVAFIFLLFN